MKNKTQNQSYAFKSPLGWISITGSTKHIHSVVFKSKKPASVNHRNPLFKKASKQLLQYLRGERKDFSLPLDPQGTRFQKRVWNALKHIPYGDTSTYLSIAKRIQQPKASRAVGQAIGKNPISVFIPCHRVIQSSGALGGYAWGPAKKQKMLLLEQN